MTSFGLRDEEELGIELADMNNHLDILYSGPTRGSNAAADTDDDSDHEMRPLPPSAQHPNQRSNVQDMLDPNWMPDLSNHVSVDVVEAFSARERSESTRTGAPVIPVGVADFSTIQVLGQGGYGKVFLVRKTTGVDSGKLYAMKTLKKAEIVRSRKDIAHTKSERNILESVRHPFIVDLHYAFHTNDKLYLILRYVNGGELFSILDREGLLLEKQASFYAAELVLALGHLHSLGIIYRDLKPENIMLDGWGHVVLTDFGMCKEKIGRNQKTHTFCGTIEYMAPEVLSREGHDQAADWWSLGALTFDMMHGQPPFTSRNRKRIIDNILKARFSFPRYFTRVSKSFLSLLLRRNPLDRVTHVDELLGHPFFNGWSYDDVYSKQIKPPFVPTIAHPEDTRNFADEFTSLAVRTDSPVLAVSDSDDTFKGFSYVAAEDGTNLLCTSPLPRPEDDPAFKPAPRHIDAARLAHDLKDLQLNPDGTARLDSDGEGDEDAHDNNNDDDGDDDADDDGGDGRGRVHDDKNVGFVAKTTNFRPAQQQQLQKQQQQQQGQEQEQEQQRHGSGKPKPVAATVTRHGQDDARDRRVVVVTGKSKGSGEELQASAPVANDKFGASQRGKQGEGEMRGSKSSSSNDESQEEREDGLELLHHPALSAIGKEQSKNVLMNPSRLECMLSSDRHSKYDTRMDLNMISGDSDDSVPASPIDAPSRGMTESWGTPHGQGGPASAHVSLSGAKNREQRSQQSGLSPKPPTVSASGPATVTYASFARQQKQQKSHQLSSPHQQPSSSPLRNTTANSTLSSSLSTSSSSSHTASNQRSGSAWGKQLPSSSKGTSMIPADSSLGLQVLIPRIDDVLAPFHSGDELTPSGSQTETTTTEAPTEVPTEVPTPRIPSISSNHGPLQAATTHASGPVGDGSEEGTWETVGAPKKGGKLSSAALHSKLAQLAEEQNMQGKGWASHEKGWGKGKGQMVHRKGSSWRDSSSSSSSTASMNTSASQRFGSTSSKKKKVRRKKRSGQPSKGEASDARVDAATAEGTARTPAPAFGEQSVASYANLFKGKESHI